MQGKGRQGKGRRGNLLDMRGAFNSQAVEHHQHVPPPRPIPHNLRPRVCAPQRELLVCRRLFVCVGVCVREREHVCVREKERTEDVRHVRVGRYTSSLPYVSTGQRAGSA